MNADGSVIPGSKDAIKFGYGSMLNLRVLLTYSFCHAGLVASSLTYHNIKESLECEPHTLKSKINKIKLIRSFTVNLSILMANKFVGSVFKLY